MDAEQRQARKLASLRAVLLRDVDRIWVDLFKPEDVPGSLQAIGPLVAARCRLAQEQGLAAAIVYADAVLRQASGDAALPVWVPPGEFVGLDRHGRSYPTMLAGALEVYAKRVASGMDPEQAAGREQTFTRRLAGSLVHDTARELLTGLADPDSAVSHPQVESWSRVAHAGACDFCVMLAGRGYVYISRDTAMMAESGKRYHDHCSCGVAIGPAGTRSPTAEQQYRAWVADGRRTQWDAGARRTAARTGTIPPSAPRTPAELHKMADDLEKFAATVETRLPDAAAKARTRAAQLRAEAAGGHGSGASIPEPRRGGRNAPNVPSPRAGGRGRGGRGGPPTVIRSGSENWNHPDHIAAMDTLANAMARRRTNPVSIDDELVALESVRQRLGITGAIDEQFKAFSADELKIAKILADEKHNVTALPESEVPGLKTADASVGAVRTEFKTLSSRANFADELNDAANKALEAVFNLKGAPINRPTAIRIAQERMRGAPLRRVRVIGRGYDVWVDRPRGRR